MKQLRYFFPMVMAASLIAGAQTHSTKETKVILVVKAETETVTHIVLFNDFEKLNRDEVAAIYPKSQFYIGLLSGSYLLEKHGLTPGERTSVIMYTNKEIFQKEAFLSEKNMVPGDKVSIANTMARIVSSKKGELTFITL